MERQYVSSSNIASIGYDPDNLVLEIEFLSGAVYQYYDVPQSIYDGQIEVLNFPVVPPDHQLS